MLPNEYINKFKPVNCDGGLLQNTDVLYTFDELLTKGTIEIMYESMAEPDDPTNASYIQKVLYFDGSTSNKNHQVGNIHTNISLINGGCIPWIDLGYRPKEIGRLKVDTKMAIRENGFQATATDYSFQDDSYTYAFGYVGAPKVDKSGVSGARLESIHATPGSPRYYEYVPTFSPCSTGGFGIKPRLPVADTGVYTDAWFVSLDGEKWSGGTDSNFKIYNTSHPKSGIVGMYRKGKYEDTDMDWEPFVAYKNYSVSKTYSNANMRDYAIYNKNGEPSITNWHQEVVNPFSIVLDAYHSRGEVYNYADSNVPITTTIDESGDIDTFDNRCKPKGSLTLFRTRNPDTAEMNIMAFAPYTYPRITGWGSPGFGTTGLAGMMNPYSQDYKGSVVIETLKITGTDEKGNPIYESVNEYKNVAYSDAPIPIYPQIESAYIWHMKIWDQDRLIRDLIPVAKGDKIYDYVMPDNGLFDLITEIFFGNSNQGGTYAMTSHGVVEGDKQLVSYQNTTTIKPEDVIPLQCIEDPTYWGKITENYYDYDNKFINNQYVDVPTWFHPDNDTIENILQFNDYKPNDFYLDGMLDTDNPDNPWENYTLKDVYDAGVVNVYYKLRTFAKTITYYQDNVRVGTKDIFFSLEDIDKATTLADLGIDIDLYWTEDFKHGRVVFNEKILAEDDVSAFIDAPSPIVVYDKLDAEEAPNLLYVEYYRGGAYDDTLITLDENDVNYLNCDLEGVVLNPNGAIKYYNHYHDALYEDEEFNYFMPYQVRVLNKYTPIHYGPGRKYKTLAQIVERDTYTIIDERNGWGRLKEYYHGWILLNQTEPMTGPGQNPDYDVPGETTATIPFAERIQITRLTIDRLWCYVPAVESWVKAEDVSFDQAGSLYHGLAMKVIHLDEIDWANVASLADIGIYPEAYKLQFHDYTGYTYNGEYTQDAFSAIHSLDFVYPETVYTSSCIYYKHAKSDENELGRVSISYTISDWNPDWDIFLETSWKSDDAGNLLLPTLYRGQPLTLTWDYYGFDKNLYRPDGYPDGFYIWNPRPYYENTPQFTFEELVVVGTQYVIYPEHHWEQYKAKVVNGWWVDTDIKTKYKPNVVLGTNIYNEDGKRYDDSEMSFILGTTGQEFLPIGKISNHGIGRANFPGDSNNIAENKYFHFSTYDLEHGYGVQMPNYLQTDNDPGLYHNMIFIGDDRRQLSTIGNKKLNKDDIHYIKLYDTLGTNASLAYGYYNYYDTSSDGAVDSTYLKKLTPRKFDTIIPSTNIWDEKYYLKQVGDGDYIGAKGITLRGTAYVRPISTNANSQVYRVYTLWGSGNHQWWEKPTALPDMSKKGYTKYSGIGWREDVDLVLKEHYPSVEDQANTGCYTYVKIYAGNVLKAFYVPMPEGTKYTLPDGTTTKLLEDSFINLLDLTETVSLTVAWEYLASTYTRASLSGGVYKIDDDLRNINNIFNPFSGWSFDTTDINYLVEVLGTITDNHSAPSYNYSHKYPDSSDSRGKEKLYKGTLVPVNKLTTDSANGVEGEWYGFINPTRWISSSDCTIYSNSKFDLTLLKETHKTITVLSTNKTITPEQTVKCYTNPINTSSLRMENLVGKYNQTIYYTYNDSFGFNGQFWMPLENTTYFTTPENLNYVVSPNSGIIIYSSPVGYSEYETGKYMMGDRLTVLYRSTYNPHWCYTGQGWIYNIDENLSLIE